MSPAICTSPQVNFSMPATSVSLDPARLSRLVSLGYEAPVHFDRANGPEDRVREKEAWRLFASEAAEAFGCQLALIEHYAPTRPERGFIAAGGLDGFEEAFSAARSRNVEDRYLSAMLYQPTGSVHLGTEFVPPERMRRSTSYSTLAMPWHLEHFLMASLLTGDGGAVFFSLGRTAREDPFVEGDKALVGSLLLSHLRRSMALQRDMAAIRGPNAGLASVMYQAPTGLVIFDGQGKPEFINQKAAAIFAANDGLALINGELRAESSLAQAQLNQALSRHPTGYPSRPSARWESAATCRRAQPLWP
jgi:PAS domain-containing protein